MWQGEDDGFHQKLAKLFPPLTVRKTLHSEARVTSITCVCAEIPSAFWLVRAGPEEVLLLFCILLFDATAEYPSVV
jgi:hypothetical protein